MFYNGFMYLNSWKNVILKLIKAAGLIFIIILFPRLEFLKFLPHQISYAIYQHDVWNIKMTLKLYYVDSFFLFKCVAFIFRGNLFLFLLALSFGKQFIMFDLQCSLFKIFADIALTPNAKI